MVSIFVWSILYILDHKQELHEKESIITLVFELLQFVLQFVLQLTLPSLQLQFQSFDLQFGNNSYNCVTIHTYHWFDRISHSTGREGANH